MSGSRARGGRAVWVECLLRARAGCHLASVAPHAGTVHAPAEPPHGVRKVPGAQVPGAGAAEPGQGKAGSIAGPHFPGGRGRRREEQSCSEGSGGVSASAPGHGGQVICEEHGDGMAVPSTRSVGR